MATQKQNEYLFRLMLLMDAQVARNPNAADNKLYVELLEVMKNSKFDINNVPTRTMSELIENWSSTRMLFNYLLKCADREQLPLGQAVLTWTNEKYDDICDAI